MLHRLIFLSVLATTLASYHDVWFSGGCGLSPYEDAGTSEDPGKIVGGQDARQHEFPWQLSLRSKYGTHSCGGIVINKDWALTAAHCVRSLTILAVRVVGGAHTRSGLTNVTQEMRVRRILIHPEYNRYTYRADIALLQLQNPLELVTEVWPVCAPDPERNYTGEAAIVSGWGTLRSGGSMAKTLQWVELPIPSNEDCQQAFDDQLEENVANIDETMMCAGNIPEHEHDSCQGDSGGPLVIKGPHGWELIGVVSYGFGCASGTPGVYARATHFIDWISEKVVPDVPPTSQPAY